MASSIKWSVIKTFIMMWIEAIVCFCRLYNNLMKSVSQTYFSQSFYSINTVITFLRFLFLILVIKFVVERFASQLFRLFWNTAFENEERVKHRTWWYVTVLYIKIDNIPNMSSLFYNGSTRLSFNEILDDTKFIDWRSSNDKKIENPFQFFSNISCWKYD